MDSSSTQELYKSSAMALMQAKKRSGAAGDPAFVEGARRVLDFIYKLWQEQQLCDVLITSNGGCVQAHRVVLGAYSDTLNRTFQGYNSKDMVKLDLTDFRSEVVMAVLNFLYTTELDLNCHMIGQVLACANELGMEVIIQVCLDYLNNLDVNNAILHYSIAENNSLNDVRDRAFLFILENFPAVSDARHFLYLPFERIFKILNSENLCVNTEMDAFSGVVRWVDFDVRSRLKHGYQLLDCVNFENLPPDELVREVEAVGWIINNPECVKNYLYRAMKYNALKYGGSPLADSYTPRERKCARGNQEPQETGSGNQLRYQDRKWSNTSNQNRGPGGPPPPAGRNFQPGGPRNLAPGGPRDPAGNRGDRQLSQRFRRTKHTDHEESLPDQRLLEEVESGPMYDAVQDYSPLKRQYTFGQTKNAQQRSSNNISASVVEQPIASSVDTFHLPGSVGPRTYGEFQSSQKRHSKHSSKSGRLSSKHKRNHHELEPTAQLQLQQSPMQYPSKSDGRLPCIVAVGGIDLESIDPDTPGKYLFTYQSQYNRWIILTNPIKKYIHHHGVGIIDGKLYVVGGAVYSSHHPENLGQATNEVHVFDPVSQSWYQAASMIYSRAYAAVVVWRKQLLVVGGEDSAKQKLDTIECYNAVANNWAVMTQMPGGAKVGTSAAVLLDCLFVVGGYNKDREYGAVLADVECYDLLNQRWTVLAPLKIPRCHASLIEVKRRLFLIGGRTAKTKLGVTSLSYVEEYDPSDDTWKRIANLETARHDAGCTAVGPLIYIIGGMRSPNPNCLQSVECFNIVTGTWVKGVEDYPHPVAGIGCCVIAFN